MSKFTLDNFYKSREWESLVGRLRIERATDDGEIICEYCGKPINRKYDCIGHHEIELTEDNVNDYSVSLNPENVKLIHFRCHNRIHGRWEGARGLVQRVYLVYSAPCSGKSTWVHEAANDDDLILDLDKLWESVCMSDRYHKPNRLKANVFGLRDCIIDQIRTRKGKWRNAFVIGGYPLATERTRLCEMLRAEPIYIEADKETCLSRAHNEAWKGYIEDWFEDYTE